jgi:hypothetical protein
LNFRNLRCWLRHPWLRTRMTAMMRLGFRLVDAVMLDSTWRGRISIDGNRCSDQRRNRKGDYARLGHLALYEFTHPDPSTL